MSIRTIKFAIREIQDFIKLYPKASPAIAFVLAISKYLTCPSSNHLRLSLCLRNNIDTDGVSIDDNQALDQLMKRLAKLGNTQQIPQSDQPIKHNVTYLQLLF